MRSILACILTAGAAAACATPAPASCAASAWRMVYRHDADGQPIDGSKQLLFDSIRRGDPVRIAWGGAFPGPDGAAASVEHSADPVFLTIASGKEVVVQLPEHIAQTAYHDPAGARLENPSVMWRGLMSTDGTFDAVMADRATGAVVRRMPQRVGLSWFVFAPDPACDRRQPLTLAIPGGVRRDDGPSN